LYYLKKFLTTLVLPVLLAKQILCNFLMSNSKVIVLGGWLEGWLYG
jgi:hypothetical protein